MTAVGCRTGHDSTKRAVEGISDGDDETNKTGAASGGKQSQQKSERQKRVKHVEDVIDDLRYASGPARASDFLLSLNNLFDGLRAELGCDLIDLPAFSRRRPRSTLGNLSMNFAFDLRLDRAVLSGPARFFHCQFVVAHIYSSVER